MSSGLINWIEVDKSLPQHGVVTLFCNMNADEVRHLCFVGWLVDEGIIDVSGAARPVQAVTHWSRILMPARPLSNEIES